MAFLTLFLGLITGVHPVELTVADPEVARIELLLDGAAVGSLTGAPWTLTADLGDELAPHELAAVGFDSEGREVAGRGSGSTCPATAPRSSWCSRATGGQVERARLIWSSVDVARPETARVFLDGAEIEGVDPRGFSLPRYDVSIPHLLQAEVQLGDTMARAQAVIGGGPGSAVSRDLTALPLYLEEGAKLPEPAEIQAGSRPGAGRSAWSPSSVRGPTCSWSRTSPGTSSAGSRACATSGWRRASRPAGGRRA